MEKAVPSGITPKNILPGITIQPQIMNTASGQIEFNLSGEGERVVLALHGGIGGCDQGQLMAHWIDSRQYRVLSPSRPGYLGTPLTSGASMEEQADLFASLLDVLHIQKVLVLAASAGGPPAYQLAARHPERMLGLVVIDGISGLYEMPITAGPMIKAFFLSDAGQKLQLKFLEWSPHFIIESTFKAEAYFNHGQLKRHVDAVLQDEGLLAFLRAFMTTMMPYRLRRQGTENDMAQCLKRDTLPLEKVRCPSLIIHGTHDADVMFHQGVYAYEHIQRAQCLWIEEGSHLDFWIGPNHCMAQQTARAFLERCSV